MRKYLIAGLLVWVPLGVTVLVIRLLVDLLDRTLLLLPPEWRPETLIGFTIPGFGIVFSFIVVLGTGMLVANILGRRLFAFWEYLLGEIPVVKYVYRLAKQIMETIVSSQGKAFRKVCLIEYPRKGIWTLCFQTGDQLGEVDARTGDHVVSVFVPTTPNPTSGFVLIVPKKDVIELDMSVDDGLKMIISIGVAVPKWKGGAGAPGEATLPGDATVPGVVAKGESTAS